MKYERRRFLVFTVLAFFVVVIGLLLVTVFTMALDMAAYAKVNQYRGDNGLIPLALWDRYLTQAVESYVYGSALAIIITMGMLIVLLGWWLREGSERG